MEILCLPLTWRSYIMALVPLHYSIIGKKKRKWKSKSQYIRSSRPDVFCKKGALRNFAKFSRKHLCQSLFFNKVIGLVCNFIKKETLAQVFSCEFYGISKNTFLNRATLVAASVCIRLIVLTLLQILKVIYLRTFTNFGAWFNLADYIIILKARMTMIFLKDSIIISVHHGTVRNDIIVPLL